MLSKEQGLKAYNYALRNLNDIKCLIPAIPAKLLYNDYLAIVKDVAEPISFLEYLNYIQEVFNVGLEEFKGEIFFSIGDDFI